MRLACRNPFLPVWLVLANLAVSATAGLRGVQSNVDPMRRILLDGTGANGGHPLLLQAETPGSLGYLDLGPTNSFFAGNSEDQLLATLGGTGLETLVIESTNQDQHGGFHVRYQQHVHGMLVEGASLVVHAGADGAISAVNGELVPIEPALSDTLALMLDGAIFSRSEHEVLANLEQARQEAEVEGGEWSEDKPRLAVVRRPLDGSACLAWKRLYTYTAPEEDSDKTGPRADLIFADVTGFARDEDSSQGDIFQGLFAPRSQDANEKPYPVLCASHPVIMGSGVPTIRTYDCQQSRGDNCVLASDSPTPISHPDIDVETAHNFALATYDYYWQNFGRDSMDDAGMPLVSRVHYGVEYNNAFWDGRRMTYGDGDGVVFIPLNRGLDVVAHELTHGVTSSTSNLIYRGQSGALNEAMSDIFAALVELENGGTNEDAWLLGEKVYTPSIAGDALRSLKDPAMFGDYDYFPTRYKGDQDYGGVHRNSGIANLAFYLLVEGGKHPRGSTDVVVPKIGAINAAYIFYHANVNCLTPDSTFYMARICTAEIFGGPFKNAVHLAWDAVGVPRLPPSVVWLTSGVPLRGQRAANYEIIRYMVGPIQEGEKVRCTTAGNNGDADLFVRFGLPAEISPSSIHNACHSFRYGSREDCTTDIALEQTMVHVAVHAWWSFAELSIVCEIIDVFDPDGSGGPTISNDVGFNDSGSND